MRPTKSRPSTAAAAAAATPSSVPEASQVGAAASMGTVCVHSPSARPRPRTMKVWKLRNWRQSTASAGRDGTAQSGGFGPPPQHAPRKSSSVAKRFEMRFFRSRWWKKWLSARQVGRRSSSSVDVARRPPGRQVASRSAETKVAAATRSSTRGRPRFSAVPSSHA